MTSNAAQPLLFLVPDSSKTCFKCKAIKPLTDFYTCKNGSLGRNAYCKPCTCASRRETRTHDTALTRTRRMGRSYGITSGQYWEMVAAQGGLCAICRRPPLGKSKKSNTFHIDHDHVTGKVRGLLCGTCNTGIGNLGDDPVRLAAAIRYLETSLARCSSRRLS